MKNLEKRIALLEISTAGIPLTTQHEAYGRILSALRNALLENANKRHLQLCKDDYKLDRRSLPATLEEIIHGLWIRIADDAVSDDDQRTLSALPIDDLRVVGMSVINVVKFYKRIFDEH